VSVVKFQVIENFYWQSVSRADVDKEGAGSVRVTICSVGELSFV